MTPREKLERVAGRVPAACVWLGVPSAVSAEVAGRAGLRLGVIDTEHGGIDTQTMTEMLRALAVTGAEGLVRVPELSEGAIKRALDAGAAGIIVPYVESAEEAAAAAAAALYAPKGRRGAAIGAIRASGFGTDPMYGPTWNGRALVVVQIESRKGVAAARDIAAVPGVDMLFFGPFDYCQDAGIDPTAEGDALAAILGEIAEAAHAEGKLAGVFPWPGSGAEALTQMGADLVAVGFDIALLGAGVRAALKGSGLA